MSTETAARSKDVAKLNDLIKGIHIAMLTTACSDGSLRSRPMATQEAEFDGTLWFFCQSDSAKVMEIERDHHINVSYAKPSDNRYISVSGLANVVRDRAKIKELWTPILKAWFPDGSDDPNIALLKIDVTKAEYWDGPSSKVVQLIGFIKASVTGQPYEPDNNEKLNMR